MADNWIRLTRQTCDNGPRFYGINMDIVSHIDVDEMDGHIVASHSLGEGESLLQGKGGRGIRHALAG